MQIAIFAMGSRGDVQPYVALGKGLQAAGHRVCILTHQDFESLVTAHQLAFQEMRGNVQAFAESPEMRALLEEGNFLKISAHTARAAQEASLHWAEDGLAACQEADLLIGGLGGLHLGFAFAEKFQVPYVQAYYLPFTPTRAFPGALVPQGLPELGGLFNRLTHHLTRQIMWQGGRKADRMVRNQVLDLPPAPFWGPFRASAKQGLPVLYGFSPSVIPSPPDWASHNHVTGYWFLDAEESWEPPPDLLSFMEAGPPPVYVGFGSMSTRNPQETGALVLAALQKSGQRAVLLSGWQGLQSAELPSSVFLLDGVPHSWLFPRMAAVVHHGGAGTTAAGLRAGVPSVLVPFFADQPFWGRRVSELGVGPRPIPRKKLTADNLADALVQATSDQSMKERAASLGAAIQQEDGVAQAVALIERFVLR